MKLSAQEGGLEVSDRPQPTTAAGGVQDAQGSAAAGDQANFAQWVSPYVARLRALAAHEVGPDDAGDVVQETLLRAWKRRALFSEARGTPGAWLAAILLDQARRHRTRHAVRRIRFIHQDDRQTQDRSMVAATRLDIESAIRRLPRRQRQVVVLHYLADLSVAEVGQVLGLEPGTIKAHLSAARRRLSILLED
jgi:RNA polymerase sigma-70 factor (ECF subfamily)